MDNLNIILSKIKNKNAQIGIIGFGTIGLNLAVQLLRQNFKVIGIDIDTNRISALQDITHSENIKISTFIESKQLHLSTSYGQLKNTDIVVICIPILLDDNEIPDINNLSNAIKSIAKYMKNIKLVILESTVYPGFSREIALPILTSSQVKVGEDFFFSYSPERFDANSNLEELSFKNKTISGITENCIEITKQFYETFTNTVTVSSIETAEITKLFENTFRFVNISLINEFAIICRKLNLNIWEIIDTAATKQFGFMPFYPSIAIGGNCIPCAPAFLNWQLSQNNIKSRLIEDSQVINSYMPEYIYKRIESFIKNSKKIIVLGITYKKDIPDIKNSSSIKLMEILIKNGFEVDYNDIFINKIAINSSVNELYSKHLNYKLLSEYEITIIATDHTDYNYEEIVKYSKIVFDTRNATRNILIDRQKIELL